MLPRSNRRRCPPRRPASKACPALSSAASSRSRARRRRNISPKLSSAWPAAKPTPRNRPSMKITAAVVRERSGAFQIETLDLCDPRADELLVEVVASGMCATDMHGRDAYYPTKFPKVFGHEGAGVVRARRQRRYPHSSRRSCGDGLSLVRRMSECQSAAAELIACMPSISR